MPNLGPENRVIFETFKVAIRDHLVFAQTHDVVEVIVVDNASDDGSVEFLRERFPAVRIVQLDSNDGPCPARNAGLEAILFTGSAQLVRELASYGVHIGGDATR